MLDYKCYDIDSLCPKCGLSGATTDFAGGLHPSVQLIIRQCSHCGYTRAELPVDHPDCVGP